MPPCKRDPAAPTWQLLKNHCAWQYGVKILLKMLIYRTHVSILKKAATPPPGVRLGFETAYWMVAQ
jgi:hypothetical protein